jgi:photosystem II stability/assembly factor-like uncharacterized protein
MFLVARSLGRFGQAWFSPEGESPTASPDGQDGLHHRLLIVAALALGASLWPQASVGLGGWTSGGPHGGTLGPVVVDPVSRIVYVLPPSGGGSIFKTTDSGHSWKPLAAQPDSSAAGLLAVDPVHAGYLLATNSFGITRSVDGGNTWAKVASDIGNGFAIFGIFFDPSRADVVYAASRSALYRSLDDGASWMALHPPVASEDSFLAFVVAKDGTLLAAASSGLLKSPDGGDSWFFGTPPAASSSFLSLVADPVGPRTVYALTYQGLFRSTDVGSSWSRRGQGVAITLSIDPSDPATLYAGGATTYYLPTTSGSVWKSTDTGVSWKMLPVPFPPGVDALSLAIGPASSMLWASTRGAGVFQSLDGGSSWVAVDGGLPGPPATAVVVDPTAPETVYAGILSPNYGRLHRTNDAGRDWTLILSESGDPGYPGSGPQFTSLAVDPTSPQVVYATTTSCIPLHGCGGASFKTADGGLSWSTLGLEGPTTAIVVDPSNPRTLYASSYNPLSPFPKNGSGYKSTDSGSTWRSLDGGFPTDRVNQWLVDSAHSDSLYVATCNAGIFASTNGGTTWDSRNAGLTDYCVRSFAEDAGPLHTLYTGTEGGIFKSSDAGAHWTPTGFSEGSTALAVDPRDPAKLFAGTLQMGVFQSRDGGESWASFNDGLSNLEVHALVIDPAGSFLHAATNAGVYDLELRRSTRVVPPRE